MKLKFNLGPLMKYPTVDKLVLLAVLTKTDDASEEFRLDQMV
jgi:hypothetical protein